MNPNMQREPVVYGLFDPDGNCGYVGTTRVNTTQRWWEHRYRAKKDHPAPVYQWIRSVGLESVKIRKLEDVPEGADAHLLEIKYIKEMLDQGHPVQNQIGRDGKPHSNGDRMKQILSEKKRGKPTWIKGKTGPEAGWTEERKKAQSERMKQRYAAK